MVGSFAAFFTCAAVALVGLALPASLLTALPRIPDLDTVAFVVGAALLVVLFSRVRFEFRQGDDSLHLSLDAAFVVLAAIVLAPGQAALVGALGGVLAVRGERPLRMLVLLAHMSAAAGLASLAVQALLSAQPDGRLVLPAAVAAAVVRSLVALAAQVSLQELRSPGAGRQLLRLTPVIVALDAALPVAAVAVAGPFLDDPFQAFAVVIAASGFTWVVLRLLHDQQRERQQNDYLRDTVSRYMPLPVAEQLLEADAASLELGGEQREITVLFCDIRGFTAWAEQHQPDDVIVELNRLLTRLSESILSTGGTLDKFTGDGLMAFWGAPNAQPDHAARALKSVPQMLMRVREFNVRRAAQGEPALEVGIGVNSGLAMVGNVGHRDRLNYTAVGDTVNTAARLEQATKQFDCPLLVSENTFLALPLSMQRQLARLTSIEVKGRRDRVRLFTLLSLARYRSTLSPRAPRGDDDAQAV